MQKPDRKLQKEDQPLRIGIWALPGFAMMSHASVVEPLRAANLLAERTFYDVLHFSSGTASFSSGGSSVPATHRIGDTPPLDLFLVVAGGDPFAFDVREISAWLRDIARQVPVIGGVSGGSVILAQAGLMAGRRMTVHWEHAAQLADIYPDLFIERRLFVIDRDRVTCGGGTAPMDLMHALISDHHGSAFARQVSDWFLHTNVRAAAAPQRALPATMSDRVPEVLRDAVSAMENHIADPLSLTQIALMTGRSDRHLNRLFHQYLQASAMSYYRAMRLDVARRLVVGSAMPLRSIAEATGFGSAAHFSNAYCAEYGIRPAAQRRR